MRFPLLDKSFSDLGSRARLQLIPSPASKSSTDRRAKAPNARQDSPANAAAFPLTFRGKVYAAGQRLPCEAEDAHLNGLRRSLQRRLMGLNLPEPESDRALESKSA